MIQLRFHSVKCITRLNKITLKVYRNYDKITTFFQKIVQLWLGIPVFRLSHKNKFDN